MIQLRKVADYKSVSSRMSKWEGGMYTCIAEREVLVPLYHIMRNQRRPRGEHFVRIHITCQTSTHCVIGVKTLCTLQFKVKCADLISDKLFKSPVDGEDYREVHYQVSIIPRSADLEFGALYRGRELGHVQADYAENLRGTV